MCCRCWDLLQVDPSWEQQAKARSSLYFCTRQRCWARNWDAVQGFQCARCWAAGPSPPQSSPPGASPLPTTVEAPHFKAAPTSCSRSPCKAPPPLLVSQSGSRSVSSGSAMTKAVPSHLPGHPSSTNTMRPPAHIRPEPQYKAPPPGGWGHFGAGLPSNAAGRWSYIVDGYIMLLQYRHLVNEATPREAALLANGVLPPSLYRR